MRIVIYTYMFAACAVAVIAARVHVVEDEQSGGNVKGTVVLSEKKVVVRGGYRGHYGLNRANRKRKKADAPGTQRVLVWIEGASNVGNEGHPEKYILDQEDKRFDPRLVAIEKHDTVRILNSDPVYHNVFSLSRTKKFDVGRRPKGAYKDVVFHKAGKVDVFCDIHSNMHAVVYVLPETMISWTIIKSDEPFSISDIPPGGYTLHIFARGFGEIKKRVRITNNDTIELGTIKLSG